MSDQSREAIRAAPAPQAYPSLDPDSATAINAHLLQVVMIRYGGKLSDRQIAQVKACLEIQTAHAETLHRFALVNADEPAFLGLTIEDHAT